jgi:hypothetical protein
MTDEELRKAGQSAKPLKLQVCHFGAIEIGIGGTGGMLISSEVLRSLGDPWFEFGKYEDGGGEDTWFCLKARARGFKIYCDVDTAIGHLTTCAIWPRRQGDSFVSRLDFEFGTLPIRKG